MVHCCILLIHRDPFSGTPKPPKANKSSVHLVDCVHSPSVITALLPEPDPTLDFDIQLYVTAVTILQVFLL